MKKLIPIILSLTLLFSFTGCTKKAPELSQETLFFENTTWGMSKAETMKALKLKDNNLEKMPPSVRDYLDIFKVKDYKYNDNVCDVYLSFTNDKINTIKADTLSAAKICSIDKVFIENEVKIYTEKFNDAQSSTSEKDNGKSTDKIWNSTKTLKDYAIENNVDIQDFINFTSPSKDGDKTYNEKEILENMDSEFSKLSKLTISVYSKPDADGYAGAIAFDGSQYSAIAPFKK